MALNKKQMQQLKLAMKRRERRPVPTYQPPEKLTLTPRERERITTSHPMMLLSIESRIVETWDELSRLDDDDVQQALIATIRKRDIAEEGPTRVLVERLAALGAQWKDNEVSEKDWLSALRAILGSVQTRSSGQKGTRDYLLYAARFVAQAGTRLSR